MLQEVIKRFTGRTPPPDCSPLGYGLGFTVRFAYPDDDGALCRLAALDSRPVPPGPLLLAEVGGELWAAVALTGEGEAIADPFRHTAELVGLLRERAERLTRSAGRHPRLQPALPLTSP